MILEKQELEEEVERFGEEEGERIPSFLLEPDRLPTPELSSLCFHSLQSTRSNDPLRASDKGPSALKLVLFQLDQHLRINLEEL